MDVYPRSFLLVCQSLAMGLSPAQGVEPLLCVRFALSEINHELDKARGHYPWRLKKKGPIELLSRLNAT
jgi:hypothetical protein